MGLGGSSDQVDAFTRFEEACEGVGPVHGLVGGILPAALAGLSRPGGPVLAH